MIIWLVQKINELFWRQHNFSLSSWEALFCRRIWSFKVDDTRQIKAAPRDSEYLSTITQIMILIQHTMCESS